MAFTSDQLKALEAIVAMGVTRVETDGNVVQYAKLDELLKLYAIMEDSVTPETSRGRKWNPVTSTGL